MHRCTLTTLRADTKFNLKEAVLPNQNRVEYPSNIWKTLLYGFNTPFAMIGSPLGLLLLLDCEVYAPGADKIQPFPSTDNKQGFQQGSNFLHGPEFFHFAKNTHKLTNILPQHRIVIIPLFLM